MGKGTSSVEVGKDGGGKDVGAGPSSGAVGRVETCLGQGDGGLVPDDGIDKGEASGRGAEGRKEDEMGR